MLIYSSLSSNLLFSSSVFFLFLLLYSSVFIGSFLQFYIFIEVLHLSAEFDERFYDYYFELFI